MRQLPAPLRRLLRRTARAILRGGPSRLRQWAVRVPFSRYHWLPGALFQGTERIAWRGVTVSLDPGEVLGYFPYFLGHYSDTELAKLSDLCASHLVLADVGANIGLISLALAAAHPTLQVYAFEPDPTIATTLRANLDLNPALHPRVQAVQAAASDIATTLTFHSSLGTENAGMGRVMRDSDLSPSATISVPAVRLDDFFRQVGMLPDVVKIDVEGHEDAVLEGMTGLFEAGYPKAILLEVHALCFPPAARLPFKEQIAHRLHQAGYHLRQLEGEQWPTAAAPAEWPDRLHLLAVRV